MAEELKLTIVSTAGSHDVDVVLDVAATPPPADAHISMWSTDISLIDMTQSSITWTSSPAPDVQAHVEISYDGSTWTEPANPGPLPLPGSATRMSVRQFVPFSNALGAYVPILECVLEAGATLNVTELDLSCSEGTADTTSSSQRAGAMTLLWPIPDALYPVIKADVVPWIDLPVPQTYGMLSNGVTDQTAFMLTDGYDPHWRTCILWADGTSPPATDRVLAQWGDDTTGLSFRIVATAGLTARVDISHTGTSYGTTAQVPMSLSPGNPKWRRFTIKEINATQSSWSLEESLDGAAWGAPASVVFTTVTINVTTGGFEFVSDNASPITILAGRLVDERGVRQAEWNPSFSSFDEETFVPAWSIVANTNVLDLQQDTVAINAFHYGYPVAPSGSAVFMSRIDGPSEWFLGATAFMPVFELTGSSGTVTLTSTKVFWTEGEPAGLAVSYGRVPGNPAKVQAAFWKEYPNGARVLHEIVQATAGVEGNSPPQASSSALAVGSTVAATATLFASFRDDTGDVDLHTFSPPRDPSTGWTERDGTIWSSSNQPNPLRLGKDPEGNWWLGSAELLTNAASKIRMRLPRMDVSNPEVNDDGNQTTSTFQLVDKTAALSKYKLTQGYQALTGDNVATHINALATLASVDLSWASLSITGFTTLFEDHYFDPGTAALDVINQLLEAQGNDHLSMSMAGKDAQGIPLTSIFSGPAAPNYEPYMHFGPSHDNIMTKAQVPAPEVDLPNRITVIPEAGSEDSEEGNGKRTVSNVDTGPLSIGLRGQIVPEVVTTKAVTQKCLDLYAERLAIQSFQGGGDRIGLTTTLCPILSPDDVIVATKPRFKIDRGRYRVTDWSAKLTPAASEDGLTMSVNVMAVTNTAMIIIDKGIGTEGIATADAWRWDFSEWDDASSPWA